jgi:ferrous iron transport protein A
MSESKRSVADLKIGEGGIIAGFDNSEMSLKLLEMGCLPGSEVELSHKAPFGDPLCIKVAGYQLLLRREEAATIKLR